MSRGSFVLYQERIALDWTREGNEWQSHLTTALRAHGVTSLQVGDKVISPTNLSWLEFSSPSLATRLLLLRAEGRPLATVVGREDSAREVEIWRTTIDEALTRTGRTRREFSWRAALGPHRSVEGHPIALAAPLRVGSIQLRPAVTALLDAHWSPILAEGTTVSFDWDAASVVASTDLRRIAALLSVQSGEAITERWPPTLVEDDIPFSPGSQTENVPLIEGTDWFDTAWQRITARRDLEGALLAYHEGALLSKEHPSFAFVAFAASIEAIGGLFLKLSKRGTGAKRRFRHALSLVVREPERRNEFEETYKLYRSPTAHIGRLHGREGSSGWVAVGGLFSIPAEVAFDFLLFDIRNLSAALLKRILTGDIEIPPSAPQ